MTTAQIDVELQSAKAKLRRGEVLQAEKLYQGILKAEPTCAEATHFLGLAALRRGDLQGALSLVQRSVELQPRRSEYHNNLATVFGQLKRPADALAAAERAIGLDSNSHDAWNSKGLALELLGKSAEAITAYRRAVALRVGYIEAMANLGNVLFQHGQFDEAVRWLREVGRYRPENAPTHKRLAVALRRMGRLVDSAASYRAAVELTPRDADLLNDCGGVLQELGDRPAAERLLRQCLAVEPNHPDGHWNLALALLATGRWKEGWEEYEWRRKLRLDAGQKREFPQRAWDGSILNGETVLVCSEQGLGDTIQFMRYAALLRARGARVIVECQPPLCQLLQSMPGITAVIGRGEPLPAFDLHARLMTLPGLFGTTPEHIPWSGPYLFAEESRMAKYHRILAADRRLKVGLVWQGRPAHKGDRFRSIPLGLFEPLARIGGIRLVSLQKNPGADQIARHRQTMDVLEWSNPMDISAEAWVDTAAMMQNLDLVIGVDTSICHLAGALGKPTWMALPVAPDWRWLQEREDTPWYPTMRLFRQKTFGDWHEVVETMASQLRQMIADNH